LESTADTIRLPPRSGPTSDIFDQLNDALLHRKRVSFVYRSLSGNSVSQRTVEPYGLFFLSSHWYLAGVDTEQRELRNFRLSRVEDLRVNAKRAQSPDYVIPTEFNLREHARSRHAWELGDGDLIEALVQFPRRTGVSFSAARLGEPVPGEPGLRRFRIRRYDAFARWLLSFGGDAAPISPPEVVDQYRRQLDATLALYNQNRDAR
jgi:predicted DNA-binding transcriptional regulator YafY